MTSGYRDLSALVRGKLRGRNSSPVTSPVSISAKGFRAFRFFLSALIVISVGSACIELGLHPLVCLFLPLVWASLWRPDYSRPFLGSDRVIGVLFLVYVSAFSLGIVLLEGRLSFPKFIIYFAFGTMLVRAFSTLNDRNIAQLIFLSFGLILINCIFTNSLLFGLLLPVYLFALMGTLFLFQLARGKTFFGEAPPPLPEARRNANWYGRFVFYALLVLGMTALLFVFVPRPFLVIPELQSAMGRDGTPTDLRRRITYGEMAGMADRNRIAFIVSVEKGPLSDLPYWRGRVLDKYDGRSWYPSGPSGLMPKRIEAQAEEHVIYGITPIRLQSRTVYVYGLPLRVGTRSGRTLQVSSAGEVIIDSPFDVCTSYRVTSVARPLPVIRSRGSAVPDRTGITPRIEQLARDWTAPYPSARDKAGILVSRLQREFKYELQPAAPPEDVHPTEHFLFTTRSGNCEYFAGTLCLMLRSLGIPARVVEGFAGKEATQVPDEFIVRFSQAHAWVEAALDDSVWTTLDATPPDAVGTGQRSFWRSLVDSYDRAQYQWIKYVVYYDRADQAFLLGLFGRMWAARFSAPHFLSAKFKPYFVTGLVGTGLLIAAVLLLFHRFRRRAGDLSALYLTTMKELTAKGLLSTVHSWHEENAQEIAQRAPAAGDALAQFMAVYLGARFGAKVVSLEDLDGARRELLRKV